MKPDFTFFVSHVEVNLFCNNSETLGALSAVWASADQPVVPVTEKKRLIIRDHGVWCNDLQVAEYDDISLQLTSSELAINELLPEWLSPYTSFHAALISKNQFACLLIGTSGSGKSSLAWQAVKSGWTFHTDELAVTDGDLFWGVRRSIQFDATQAREALPVHFEVADRDVYKWHDVNLGQLAQPIIPVPGTAGTVSLGMVTTVLLSMGGEDSLTPVEPVVTLLHLHEGCFGKPKHDLGALTGKAFFLNWREPEVAIRCLEQTLNHQTNLSARSS